DPAAAGDVFTLPGVGFPEYGLVHPVRLLQHALAAAEGLEHLHRPAGDAIRLPERQWARLLLDDAGVDVGESRELRRQRPACRPAADDSNVASRTRRAVCA